jgi:alcohol dehydrogenase class IV
VLRINEFQNPKKIIFGIGAVEKVGQEIKSLNASNVFVVTDENIEKTGIAGKILTELEKANLDYTLYKIPASEPTMDSSREIAKEIRKQEYDAVAGIGGGSCLDSAKLASMMANNFEDVSKYVAKVKGDVTQVKNATLPKILIPTTSGTGSEASNTLVIIEEQFKTWITDNKLLAEVAIVDPNLTLTLPPRMTAGSGMDALSHAMEAMMSAQANPISDSLAREAISLVFNNLRTVYHCGHDLEARRNMSLAAALGGWVIGFPWIGGPATIGHCISEAIGAKYKIPHGEACAIALPYAMDYNLPLLIDKLASLAPFISEDLVGPRNRETAFNLVRATVELMEEIDLPTSLSEEGVPKEDLKSLAEYIVNERQYLYDLKAFNPRRLTLRNVTELLERMWEGRIGKET